MKQRRKKLRWLSESAMMAAVLALLSPWSIPIGPVPCTLATLALFLVASISRVSVAASATAVYLLLGAVGLPIFSSFGGGFGVFVSATGGFLWSYLPAAIIVSLFAKKEKGRAILLPLGMVAATLLIDTTGLLWFAFVTDATLSEAILSAVLPFLLPDAVKIAAASLIACLLKRRFGNGSLSEWFY